jgi:hypothetical protein
MFTWHLLTNEVGQGLDVFAVFDARLGERTAQCREPAGLLVSVQNVATTDLETRVLMARGIDITERRGPGTASQASLL